MTVPTVDAALHARLQHLAAEVRAGAVCAVCADSPAAPCGACAERRARVAALNRARAPLAVIAADVALPAWRVARILREQRLGDDAGAERAANARLLVDELGERLVALILAGPPRRPAGHPAVRRWHAGVRRLLRARGWNPRAVSLVLAGTHVPNAPLRAAVVAYRAANAPAATSELLAARAGLRCGTYLDRVLGARATPRTVRRGVPYGGRAMTTIRVEHAAAIAAAIGLAPRELPGL